MEYISIIIAYTEAPLHIGSSEYLFLRNAANSQR